MHNFDVIFICFTNVIFHIKRSKEKRKEKKREKDKNIMNFSDKRIPQDQDNGKTMDPEHQQPSPTGGKKKQNIESVSQWEDVGDIKLEVQRPKLWMLYNYGTWTRSTW